jgi:secreted PhoX family phosphatase
MKGKLHPRNDATLNPSGNESIRELIERVDLQRRRILQGSASATLLASAGGLTLSGVVTSVGATSLSRAERGRGVGIGFEPVPADTLPLADQVVVPDGYTAKVLVAWGDPIVRGGTDYKPDASNSAAEQLKQFGSTTTACISFPSREGTATACCA